MTSTEAAASVELRHDYAPGSEPGGPVVFLPALFAGDWIWEPTAARLRAHGFGVIRLLDPLVQYDWASGGIEELRAALRVILDQHGVERAMLCGNSLGALMALDFARAYPGRVEGVVVSGAPGLEPERSTAPEAGHPGHAAPHVAPAPPTSPAPRWIMREFVSQMLEHLSYDPRLATPLYRQTNGGISERQRLVTLVRARKAARAYPLARILPDIRCRVFLVWGESDRITPLAWWHPWPQTHPLFEVRTIPRCGHSPMFERPDVFSELLMGFLLRNGARSGALQVSHARSLPSQAVRAST